MICISESTNQLHERDRLELKGLLKQIWILKGLLKKSESIALRLKTSWEIS